MWHQNLMTGTEMVPETFIIFHQLAWLIAREDLIACEILAILMENDWLSISKSKLYRYTWKTLTEIKSISEYFISSFFTQSLKTENSLYKSIILSEVWILVTRAEGTTQIEVAWEQVAQGNKREDIRGDGEDDLYTLYFPHNLYSSRSIIRWPNNGERDG
jgi:hypothetical protein